MPDIAIIGSGNATRSCDDLLSRAGFDVRRSLDLEDGDRCPVILGDTPAAFAVARQLVAGRHHLLLASPSSLSASQLSAFLAARHARHALFIWSERRFHPGYHFVRGLVEADPVAWQPRYVRHTSLLPEPPSATATRWRTLEAITLILQLAMAEPLRVAAAAAAENEHRNVADFVSLNLQLARGSASIQVGLGESIARQETTLAGAYRKAYIDELNESVPVRITDESLTAAARPSRWVSCPSPSQDELRRQQCLTFLEAAQRPSLAEEEAALWARAVATLHAAEASLSEGGAAIAVDEQEQPGFRVIPGRSPSPGVVTRLAPA